MYFLVFILPFVISALICHSIAKSRGSNTRFWGVMGAVFGPLAIPFVYFSKKNNT